FTRRGNSALPLGDPGLPLPQAVEAVERWYADRELPPRLQLPLSSGAAALADVLSGRGWRREMAVHVMTAELAPVLRATRGSVSPDVRVDEEPDDAWLAVYRSGEGPLPDAGPRELLVNHADAGFASIRLDEECVAIARAA